MGGTALGSAERSFNSIFRGFSATSIIHHDGSAAVEAFQSDDELVLGIDRSRESLVRPVAVDGENGGEFNLIADDQYSIRQNKIGYFGSLEEGRVVLDDRALIGTVIKTADDHTA